MKTEEIAPAPPAERWILDASRSVSELRCRLTKGRRRERRLRPRIERENADVDVVASSAMTVEGALRSIARDLLEICDPTGVDDGASAQPPTELGALVAYEGSDPHTSVGRDTEEAKALLDLRRTLRRLAPVSLDVACRIADVAMDIDDDARTEVDAERSCLVLFGHWLPIAPHLHPVARDVLGSMRPPPSLSRGEEDHRDTGSMDVDDDVYPEGDGVGAGANPANPFAGASPATKDESTTVTSLPMPSASETAIIEASYHVLSFFLSSSPHLMSSWSSGDWDGGDDDDNDDTADVRGWFDDWSFLRTLLRRCLDAEKLCKKRRSDEEEEEEDNDMAVDDTTAAIDDASKGAGTVPSSLEWIAKEKMRRRKCDWVTWYAARAVAELFRHVTPIGRLDLLRKVDAGHELPLWIRDMRDAHGLAERGFAGCGGDDEGVPDLHELRAVVPLHRRLALVGGGLVFPRRPAVRRRRRERRGATTHDGGDREMPPRSSRPRPRGRGRGVGLVRTPTTEANLHSLALALLQAPPSPILVCGPRGSGKSTLIREVARLVRGGGGGSGDGDDYEDDNVDDYLLELHVDDDTDSKTLLGQHAATDVPGEFAWRPGPLARAATAGRWVLLEEADRCPPEILASVKTLLEYGEVRVNSRRTVRAHPDFLFFATATSVAGPNRLLLGPNLWTRVEVSPLSPAEVGDVAGSAYPSLPPTVLDSCMRCFLALGGATAAAAPGGEGDGAGGVDDDGDARPPAAGTVAPTRRGGGRTPSVRDLLKLCRRIDSSPSLHFEHGSGGERSAAGGDRVEGGDDGCFSSPSSSSTFVTESQRTLCLAETVDVFVASDPSVEGRRDFVTGVAAPAWGISPDLAVRYVEGRRPTVSTALCGGDVVEVGRARVGMAQRGRRRRRNGGEDGSLPDEEEVSSGDEGGGDGVTLRSDGNSRGVGGFTTTTFTETAHSLRLIESLCVCVSNNEPTLLVGETGCGKTTMLQRLADMTGRTLVVQNLSLQTDSTDLLGGYRPLEMGQVARRLLVTFVEVFTSTFSRRENGEFLEYVNSAYERGQWRRLSQCFRRAARMGLKKLKEIASRNEGEANVATPMSATWEAFHAAAERFERQRLASETGLAFAFTEGALVEAIREGRWVLLDEINLASSETLQRLCGLLDDSNGSLTLTERGDAHALIRHPDFRIFAAMNPATDTGKKDLPASMRTRFTEYYVDELEDRVELRSVAGRYLSGAIALSGIKTIENSDIVMSSIDVYLNCRDLADKILVDGSGHRPRYTLRTLSRALSAARNLVVQQGFAPHRAVLEGFDLAFEGPLDSPSRSLLQKALSASFAKGLTKKELDRPGRRPGGKRGSEQYVLLEPFWIAKGPIDCVDWTDREPQNGKSKFVLTPSANIHLRRLSRAVASGPWPVLLEGPTSAGKTTLVEYLASRCGHRCVRINNHERTDVQEYTGCYVADTSGSLSFRYGMLAEALRKGDWVILDELNLAPCEVLEALNRLLDDNRELYLPETNETIKPHPNFRLFATQNPSGAIYGGRKPLSRAFRNRFVEVHMGDIPADEMVAILELKCGCPPSHGTLLVKVMTALRQRRSKYGVFRGKDGLISPRDLLRWAERGGSSKSDLAMEGYMLLAERLRENEEKEIVQHEIEKHFRVTIDCDRIYYGAASASRCALQALTNGPCHNKHSGATIAPTRSLLRLLHLVQRCVDQREPVLLCGETGSGKTTVIQLLHLVLQRQLHVVNCHATTETSDLLGGLRPLRGRDDIARDMVHRTKNVLRSLPPQYLQISDLDVPQFLSMDSDFEKDFVCKKQRTPYPPDAADIVLDFVRKLWSTTRNRDARILVEDKIEPGSMSVQSKSRERKRRKVDAYRKNEGEKYQNHPLYVLLQDIEQMYRKFTSHFEWVNGPLVTAMKHGHLLLLDEINLAEDAVLERLNSVLEPGRKLVLAEKGGGGGESNSPVFSPEDCDSNKIEAAADFRIFATMNPGGDFGKRELSPALRSRFTEIWVPTVLDREDVDLILRRTLSPSTESSGEIETVAKPTLTVAQASMFDQVRVAMLEYFFWFNQTICGAPSASCADFELSLRDILTWARFVFDVCRDNRNMNAWLVYVHGCALMHLDGLGLGTGYSSENAADTKRAAKAYLRSQIPAHALESLAGFLDERAITARDFVRNEGTFGVQPFFIPTGPLPVPNESKFSLLAPTTGNNLQRVLRAMQLSKPILLEGSPGVGKTSLISALAACSGNKLVRINLSEQTDIADLMGSDLPVPSTTHQSESSETDQSKGTTKASFKWCDGVFLRALKRGDWVLLDELNLASQSVLEGLNSCLDHRAQVFIPELGRTFECPPTFRVFAAQNPLGQGGGRKGLPKSFLNRFTKVYVALSSGDINTIVTNRFPQIPRSVIEKIVHFNGVIACEVVGGGKYGQLGSPWEFNLRDVFRWCELMIAEDRINGLTDAIGFVDTLYAQRFRSTADREYVSRRCEEHFGTSICQTRCPSFGMTDTYVHVGSVAISRSLEPMGTGGDSLRRGLGTNLLRSLMSPMEAVARCINMNWPCLLVGPSSSGKSTLLRMLSDSCNIRMEEAAMTPSSDVTDLIGCFEQVDSSEMALLLRKHAQSLQDMASQTIYGDFDLAISNRISDLCEELKNIYCSEPDSSVAGVEIVRLLEDVEEAVAQDANFRDLAKQSLDAIRETVTLICSGKKEAATNAAHFRWVDGVLVAAMESGSWLHLENANLCPSSVLDRLNPLLESDGQLVLTECGLPDSVEGGSHGGARVVKPHKNFRIFLSMDPDAGEVSRAMRNRCVEVSLIAPCASDLMLPCSQTVKETGKDCPAGASGMQISTPGAYDALESLGKSGVMSAEVAREMVNVHRRIHLASEMNAKESPCAKQLERWGCTASALNVRGCATVPAFKDSCYFVYGSFNVDGRRYVAKELVAESSFHENSPIIAGHNFRETWARSHIFGKFSCDAKLIEAIETMKSIGVSENGRLPLGLVFVDADLRDGASTTNDGLDKISLTLTAAAASLPKIQQQLCALFASKMSLDDMEERRTFFDGYGSELSRGLDFMLSRLNEALFDATEGRPLGCFDANLTPCVLQRPFDFSNCMNCLEAPQREVPVNLRNEASEAHSKVATCQDYVHLFCTNRMSQLFEEHATYCRVEFKSPSSLADMTAMEVSFCLDRGNIDEAIVDCPVVPLISPFFRAIDALVRDCGQQHVRHLSVVLAHRDRLWRFLQSEPFRPGAPSTLTLSFDESGFLVHWRWMKKALRSLYGVAGFVRHQKLQKSTRTLDNVVRDIDRALHLLFGGNINSSNILWKKEGHPVIPSQAVHWEARQSLRNLSNSCRLFEEEEVGLVGASSGVIDVVSLETLIDKKHPCLYVEYAWKTDLLSSLCMSQWATTDEIKGHHRSDVGNKLSRDLVSAPVALQKRIDETKRCFEARLQALALEHMASDNVNAISTDDIDRISTQWSTHSRDLSVSLLERWSSIQVSQLTEVWCVAEEISIITAIVSAVGLRNDGKIFLDDLRAYIPRMKRFIGISLENDLRSVEDLRPFQTFVWACEEDSFSSTNLQHLWRCIFPLMMYYSGCHLWCNSYTHVDCISDELKSPSLWNEKMSCLDLKEESIAQKPLPLQVSPEQASNAGHIRLRHPIRDRLIMRVVGSLGGVQGTCGRPTVPHFTLDNYSTRQRQKQMVTRQLAMLPAFQVRCDVDLVRHLFVSVLDAYRNEYENEEAFDELLSIILPSTHESTSITKEKVALVLGQVKDESFRSLVKDVVLPLALALQSISNEADGGREAQRDKVACAWIYIGLLRLHLLVPTSPLDPCQKPAAKVARLNDHLVELGAQVTARRWDSRLNHCRNSPLDAYFLKLVEEAESTRKKCEQQKAKMIERPPHAPAFVDLFREVRRFANTTASVESVLSLTGFLSNNGQARCEEKRTRETSWQTSASAFCARLSSHYEAYEDVTIPILNAVKNIQWGFRELSAGCSRKSLSTNFVLVQKLQESLLVFPSTTEHSQNVQSVARAFITTDSVLDTLADHFATDCALSKAGAFDAARRCQASVLMAWLAHIFLRSQSLGGVFDRQQLGIISELFDAFVAALVHCEQVDASVETETSNMSRTPAWVEAEEEERKYRAQFPNHLTEFNSIIETIDLADGDMERSDENAEPSLPANGGNNTDAIKSILCLTPEHIAFLCFVHREIFRERAHGANDVCRMHAFKFAYSASGQLLPVVKCMDRTCDDRKSTAAHILGLAISMKANGHMQSLSTPMVVDFHNDPNPLEVLKAEPILRRLLGRVAQLLEVFPGHSVLVAVGQIAERVMQLDLTTVSLAKVLTGLEVILRKAQEWEQHASSRVTIGGALNEVSAIVARWRRLELSSWPALLDVRERSHMERARGHWIRLYKLINVEHQSNQKKDCSSPQHGKCADVMRRQDLSISPAWVWAGFCKGLPENQTIGVNTFSVTNSGEETESAFVEALDGFLLSTGIGEFKGRLDLLTAFASQVSRECEVESEDAYADRDVYFRRLMFARTISSLSKHYSQFEPLIQAVRNDGRAPIEKRLQEEVKLAKWDEQTYYSLAESAEKSHRKLNKYLRKYDEVLDMSVSAVLEKDLLRGVRSSNESSEESVATVPQNVELFPNLSNIDANKTDGSQTCTRSITWSSSLGTERRNWAVTSDCIDWCDKFVLGMKRYSVKMSALLGEDELTDSWPRKGALLANTLCQSIFDRIDSLRGEKVSKMMKQRALVDLFKTLKNEGLSSLKWAVAAQVREMRHILALPDSSTWIDQLHLGIPSSSLNSAEHYFFRSAVEISRLRTEIAMFGSKYMSQRQTHLMVGFSEHMLYMLCQQRCLLSNVAEHMAVVEAELELLSTIGDLPRGQALLRGYVERFELKYKYAIESLRQMVLLLTTSSPLVAETEKASVIRDVTSTIQRCIVCLTGTFSTSTRSYIKQTLPRLITNARLLEIAKASQALAEVVKNVELCMEKCERCKCLPCDIFANCLEDLSAAMHSANFSHSQENVESTHADERRKEANGLLSSIVQRTLLAAQALCQKTGDFVNNAGVGDEEGNHVNCATLRECHARTVLEFGSIGLSKLAEMLQELMLDLSSFSEIVDAEDQDRKLYGRASLDACALVMHIGKACRRRIADLIDFYRGSAKLLYVLVRIFRVLVSKGFCSSDVADEEDPSGDANASGMTFEEEGTGMGEGEGKEDVTDQIENEEQLLGLKGDDMHKKEPETKEQRQLDDEEADTGMEMEQDFDGEMCEMPNKETDENDEEKDNDTEEEELDREMGDGSSPNEEVVDEKLWDEDEDGKDNDENQEEKFEKDSKVSGGALDDEIRTKQEEEDTDGKENGRGAEDNDQENEAHRQKEEDDHDGISDEDTAGNDIVNDDNNNNYEEKHVDVRDESMADEVDPHEAVDDDEMELNEDMDIDGEGDDGEDNEPNHGDATIEGNESEGESKMEEEEIEGEGGCDDDEVCSPTAGTSGNTEDQEVGSEKEGAEDEEAPDVKTNEKCNEKDQPYGIAAEIGNDHAKHNEVQREEKHDGDGKGGVLDDEGGGEDDEEVGEEDTGMNGGAEHEDSAGDWQTSKDATSTQASGKPCKAKVDQPNPFRDPGNAEKFWHKRLNMIADIELEDTIDDGQMDQKDEQHQDNETTSKGVFEFTKKGESGSTQVLGDVAEEHASRLDIEDANAEENETLDTTTDNTEAREKEKEGGKDTHSVERTLKTDMMTPEKLDIDEKCSTKSADEHMCDDDPEADDIPPSPCSDDVETKDNSEGSDRRNRVQSDMAQLHLSDDGKHTQIVPRYDLIDVHTGPQLTASEVAEARSRWATLNGETNNLSRRLCEKLRLVMEPLVATKLRGDYRSGKRINMKRVIGYIASGYRKDKIWLRRTKPAKRDYRVLLAVDNSESMQKSGAGEMALAALATLANGMSQLEIGELGVASFGEQMRLLHPFQRPFTQESGTNLVCNFKFDEKRTRTTLCVENAITALENADGGSGSCSSLQLVFMISDGRIERDSKTKLRRLVREMSEQNVLLVMIIVEGGQNSNEKESIINMKEVTFERGKPKVTQFIEDYPFPYYMLLNDMATLPEVLGDALRQWFEMLAQLQSCSTGR